MCTCVCARVSIRPPVRRERAGGCACACARARGRRWLACLAASHAASSLPLLRRCDGDWSIIVTGTVWPSIFHRCHLRPKVTRKRVGWLQGGGGWHQTHATCTTIRGPRVFCRSMEAVAVALFDRPLHMTGCAGRSALLKLPACHKHSAPVRTTNRRPTTHRPHHPFLQLWLPRRTCSLRCLKASGPAPS